MEFIAYLPLAFLGGAILNVMPCVLPVLTLKVFHTIEVYGQEDARPRLHALAYGAGTTLAFVGFAAIIVALRASGELLGWGMQFQHPPVVAGVTALVFVFALNALGLFEINVSLRGDSGRHGVSGSLANGVLAAIMSTPCTAPFLGSAAAIALAADTPDWVTLSLFAAVGVGLASPYMVIGFVPALGRLLPRPGKWMETFKHLMGFTLLGAVVWLFGAFQSQVTPQSANLFLAFLLVAAVGAWAWGRFAALHHTTLRRVLVRGGVVAGIGLAGSQLLAFERPVARAAMVAACAGDVDDDPIIQAGKIGWRSFSPEVVQRELERNRPVFMDYTADWCAACKTNEKVFLETDTVRGALLETGILPMMADMTNENEVIEAWLEKLRRNGKPVSGIPAYAIYMPDNTVDVLPVTITAELVAERLRAAAERFPRVARN